MQTASPSTSSQVASPARTLVSQGLEAAKGSGPPSRGPARACGLSISASSASLSPNGSSLKMCPPSALADWTSSSMASHRSGTMRNGIVSSLPALALRTREIVKSEEHTSDLQSLMRISYAVFCLKKKPNTNPNTKTRRIIVIKHLKKYSCKDSTNTHTQDTHRDLPIFTSKQKR